MLRQMLGRGASATVFRATQRSLGRDVAIKLLHPSAMRTERCLKRFADEVTALTRLQHPGVVKVFERGVDGNIHYLVMELVDAPTMRRRRNQGWRPSSLEVAEIGRSLLDALGATHELGILHRDLKPENVFAEEGSRTRIVDFGLAVIAGEETAHTESGYTVGTPQYLPPEILFGSDHTVATDLYAVGVILYELLLGDLPFPVERGALVAAKRHALPPLAARVPDVDPALAAVIERAVALDPSSRFPDVGSFAQALAAPVRTGPVRQEAPIRPRVSKITWILVGLGLGITGDHAWRALRSRESTPGPPARMIASAPALDPALVALETSLRRELTLLDGMARRAPDPRVPGKELPELDQFERVRKQMVKILEEFGLMVATWDQGARAGSEWLEVAFPLLESFFEIFDRASLAQRRDPEIQMPLSDLKDLVENGTQSRPVFRALFGLVTAARLRSLDPELLDPERARHWELRMVELDETLPAGWKRSLSGMAARIRFHSRLARILHRAGKESIVLDFRGGTRLVSRAALQFRRVIELGREALPRLQDPGAKEHPAIRPALECILTAAARLCDFPNNLVGESQRKDSLLLAIAWRKSLDPEVREDLEGPLAVLERYVTREGLTPGK